MQNKSQPQTDRLVINYRLFFLFSNSLKEAFVPDFAIVPKLEINSSLDMPIPLSEIFKVLAFGSTLILILRSIVDANDLSVKLLYLLLSQASDALEINSRKKYLCYCIMN